MTSPNTGPRSMGRPFDATLRVAKAVGLALLAVGLYIALNLLVFALLDRSAGAVTMTLVANAALCFIVLLVAIVAARTGRRSPLLPPGRPTASIDLRSSAVLLGALVIVWAAGQASAVWLQTHGFGKEFGQYQDQLREANPLVLLVTVIVAAPVAEELLIRAVVYPRLRAAMGMWPAAVISSAVFAILHGTAVHLAYTFTLGMLLAIAYELTHRIWVPIAMHLVFNLGVLVPASLVEPLANVPFLTIGSLAATATIIGTPVLLRRLAIKDDAQNQTQLGSGSSSIV